MDVTNINHVGIVVRDLAATSARYEAMGFKLTPYSPHSGAWKSGAPVEPLGSGNRCVMFADSYLEILASENPARPAQRMTNFLNHHQGAHIICFDTDDCGAVEKRLRANGIETSGVIPLQREIDTPDGMRTARFERVQFAPKDTPEGYVQSARHLTPEYVYQTRYTGHENGCFQLAEVILATHEIEATARRYETYLGFEPLRTDETAQFRLPLGTTLTILHPAKVSAHLPGTLLPPLPGIVAVGFKTSDLRALAARLKGRGFTVNACGDRIQVPAEEAMGVALLFRT